MHLLIFVDAYQKYLEAIKLHNAWLDTKDHPDDMADDIVLSYKTALKEMKEILINSTVKYDFQIITIAIFFLCPVRVKVSLICNHARLFLYNLITIPDYLHSGRENVIYVTYIKECYIFYYFKCIFMAIGELFLEKRRCIFTLYEKFHHCYDNI